MHNANPIETKAFRQQLRREATPCERMLWKRRRNRQMENLKFRQQHGYGVHVMDFYCPEIRRCIEVDGSVHDSIEAQLKDAERTSFLHANGISVIRFGNEEFENDIEHVLQQIREFINSEARHHRYPNNKIVSPNGSQRRTGLQPACPGSPSPISGDPRGGR